MLNTESTGLEKTFKAIESNCYVRTVRAPGFLTEAKASCTVWSGSQLGAAGKHRRVIHRTLASTSTAACGIWIQHFSRDGRVQNQPFACLARISKTLLRSSCVCFTAKTAISIRQEKIERAVVCSEYPFKKDPRFSLEVVLKRECCKEPLLIKCCLRSFQLHESPNRAEGL